MTKYWVGTTTYSYDFCTETFPTTTWINEIEAAIALWPHYVKWVTDGTNIISKTGTSSNCGTSSCANNVFTCDVNIQGPTSANRIIRAYYQSHHNNVCNAPMMSTGTKACFTYDDPADGITTSLMIFASDDIQRDWGIDDHADQNDECSYLFDVALHEAGHAFGLGDVKWDANQAIHTAMRQSTKGPCVPFPEDIGAMMTLHQSVP